MMTHPHEQEERDFGQGPRLWDADPDVCCAAFQLGACAHTEAAAEQHDPDPLILCEYEHETWGPHEGCAEFMDGPETWPCGQPATAIIISTDLQTQAEWEAHGPWTQEDIDRSEGHLAWPTSAGFACDEHLSTMTAEEGPWAADLYVERFVQEGAA